MMLKIANCRERQQRLLRHMEASQLDMVILQNPKTVYYFTGALVDPNWPQAFVMDRSGRSLLVTNREPAQSAAGEVRLYTGYTLEKAFGRTTMQAELSDAISRFASAGTTNAAIEFDFTSAGVLARLSCVVSDITPALSEMRRRKDTDELDCMRRTVELTEAGYAAIKEALGPGMTEWHVYNVIHEAMVRAANTSVELRGDFACGTRAIKGGGPPTDQVVASGELYILDLFPIFEGYVCDLCRTFVADKASGLQRDAWAHILETHAIAQALIRPGTPARTVYEETKAHLQQFRHASDSFTHHAGHGVGMDGWEYPWLNAGTDQVLQEGEVIAFEPGLYSEEMCGGIRLEHNYLVTVDGPVALDSFPMDLK
ncbi:MAG: M24 family metallopeptidase [Bryobacteraceae bacterium]